MDVYNAFLQGDLYKQVDMEYFKVSNLKETLEFENYSNFYFV